MEIGFWTSILDLDRKALKKASAVPEHTQEFLVRYAGVDTCHLLGTKFSKAVIGCLTGKAGEEGAGRELDFQTDVVNVLKQLAPSEVPSRKN